jgi:D-alanyl-D-alanine carboxypeptidase
LFFPFRQTSAAASPKNTANVFQEIFFSSVFQYHTPSTHYNRKMKIMTVKSAETSGCQQHFKGIQTGYTQAAHRSIVPSSCRNRGNSARRHMTPVRNPGEAP